MKTGALGQGISITGMFAAQESGPQRAIAKKSDFFFAAEGQQIGFGFARRQAARGLGHFHPAQSQAPAHFECLAELVAFEGAAAYDCDQSRIACRVHGAERFFQRRAGIVAMKHIDVEAASAKPLQTRLQCLADMIAGEVGWWLLRPLCAMYPE
jgi:hypothetical protein